MAFLVGSIAAFDGPARQAFVSEMVDVDDLPNAVALNTASFNLGRVFGPAVAGLLIAAVGSGWVFVLNALGYVAVLVALSRIRHADLARRRRVPRATAEACARGSATSGRVPTSFSSWSSPSSSGPSASTSS